MTTTTTIADAMQDASIMKSLVALSRDGAGESVAEFRIGIRSVPYLADHGFQDMVVLPGSFYVEMALCVDHELCKRVVGQVRNVAFHNPIILSQEDTLVRVHARDRGDGCVEYVFYEAGVESGSASRSAQQPAAKLEIDRNCGMSLAVEAGASSPGALRPQSHAAIEAADFYRTLRTNGNQYGPRFQHLSRIWREGKQVLGKIAFVRGRGGNGPHGLNPYLLDSITQLLAPFVMEERKTFVLQSIEKVEFAGLDFPETLWGHATQLPARGGDGKGVRGNIRVVDEAGRAYLELTGVVLTLLDAAAVDDEKPATTFVVAANFTAEPLEDSLKFWGDHFGMRIHTEFAPYNQIFQQMLDPGSAMRRNNDGVNIVLLGLEEWALGDPHSTLTLNNGQAEKCFGSRARRVLPNGLEIVHLNQYETDYLYKEIFEDQCYLRHGIQLRDGATVLDIGANIGLFSLFVMSRCKNPTIYAFEPAPVVFDLLRANSSAYGPNIRALNVGVSDKAKTATFTFYEKSSVFSGFHSDAAEDGEAIRAVVRNMLSRLSVADESVEEYVNELTADRLSHRDYECRLTCVSDIIRENQLESIDLLKIDAEKSELDIIAGIERGDWPKINQIVIEIHDPTREALTRTQKLLIEKGFHCAVEQESLLEHAGLFNLYATRRAVGGAVGTGADHAEDASSTVGAARRRAAGLRRNVEDFGAALRSFMERSSVPLLLCVCPRTPPAVADAELNAALDDAEQSLLSEAGTIARVHSIGSTALLQRFPIKEYYDPDSHHVGHIPYTPHGYAAIGSALVRSVYNLKRGPFKAIALDCDNTLWKGVCGEDGPGGVEVSTHHRALQEFMIAQAESGMLLCLCSKNNEADVLAVFDQRTDMPLKREHLVSWRINWNSKSENMKLLAKELNLGLDSFIFIDDNPVECADVRFNCPGVLSLQLPRNVEQFSRFLNNVWAFDRADSTREDRNRTRMYQESANRERYREKSMSLKDFVKGLQLQVDVAEPTEKQLERVSQLTFRTNQFNFTTVRRSKEEIRALLQREEAKCLVVSVVDRFGDYGLVGVLIFLAEADRYKVDTFLLSCRVLGRGVEHALVSRLGQWAVKEGKAFVEFPYVASGRNLPALEFIRSIGERYRNEAGTTWAFPAEQLVCVEYGPGDESPAAPAMSDNEAPERGVAYPVSPLGAVDQSECLQKIGEHLCDVEQITRAIEEFRLRDQPAQGGTDATQGSTLETGLLSIWRKVLSRPRIGINDNFFEVGGTSLRAVQVVATIKKDLQQTLSIVNLFECPTVKLLAAKLSAETGGVHGLSATSTVVARGQRRRVVNLRRKTS